MSPTATGLIGFAAWFALLSVALGVYRVVLVLRGEKAANSFTPSGTELAPFGQRLTRARDNCFETLPLFAALALGAQLSGQLAVTDSLALWVLGLRVVQSCVHIASTSVPAVQARAALFFAQMLIYVWWSIQLLG
jgi:uncharacterized MAPEG superfamily protein